MVTIDSAAWMYFSISSGERLSAALLPLMRGGTERDRQLAGLARVIERVRETDESPSQRAARIVLAYAQGKQAEITPVQRASIGR